MQLEAEPRDTSSLMVIASAGAILSQSIKARLAAVLDWTDGQFEFTASPISGPDALGMSVTELLLAHARDRDEAGASG